MGNDKFSENKWKTIAIIFIVLFCLETFVLVWAATTGMSDLAREEECVMNVCGENHAYQYYPSTKFCYCYNEFGERIKEQLIK